MNKAVILISFYRHADSVKVNKP